jgi:mannose-6-phosphate isomerase-like protein (cupin superfamily)
MNALEKLPDTAAIQTLKEALSHLPQAELVTNHHFADGMYCRELFRPAGTLIVGKVHKREHFYIVLSGEVTVSGDGYRERIKAPRILVSAPGTQRAVFAHEDSRCITVHRTDSRDLQAIEQELVEHDETALFDARNELKAPALEVES